ncbi:hypothetical protein WM43_09185 [Aeromonas veronii]|jgi:hypothetical protein|uniref:Uncharacterized protein n=2 Tax=Aeromonas veronii TaxID=654 RepID=A0AAC9FLG8_AERVE|nr:hypothetical protein WM43_09185 [Aeromonas veronii]OEC57257.1 hypothetical protein A9G04_05915 [Aeromonas sp. ANNP30]OEC66208.1 hypothetical protein A9G49_05650 [Aeromonas sp. ANP5]AYV38525.1 hypothetical protein EFI48_17855 [Aeromonas veronii]KZW94713.1 hypothetical protein WM54_18845 [Aeromonas veronii]
METGRLEPTLLQSADMAEPSKMFIVREKIFFVFALEGLATLPHIRDISNLAWNGHSSKQQ